MKATVLAKDFLVVWKFICTICDHICNLQTRPFGIGKFWINRCASCILYTGSILNWLSCISPNPYVCFTWCMRLVGDAVKYNHIVVMYFPRHWSIFITNHMPCSKSHHQYVQMILVSANSTGMVENCGEFAAEYVHATTCFFSFFLMCLNLFSSNNSMHVNLISHERLVLERPDGLYHVIKTTYVKYDAAC